MPSSTDSSSALRGPAARVRRGLVLVFAAAVLAAGCAAMDQVPDSQVRYEDGGTLGDAGYFYDALRPYGRWMELEPYGLVWLPDGLGPSWSPYSQGFWTYSDYGWTWVDRQPWGWAPFHYGRWWLDPEYAWVWIPGTEWAPAWVAWRENESYVAWAPLPPTIHWSFTVPLHSGGPSVDALPSTWWNVARPSDLVATDLHDRLVPTSDKLTALTRMQDRTRITAREDRPFNEGPSVNLVERRLGRELPRYHVVDAPALATTREAVGGTTLRFFRPDAEQLAHRTVGRGDNRQPPPAATVEPVRGGAPGRDLLHGGRKAVAPPDSTRGLEAYLAGQRKRMLDDQAQERRRVQEEGGDLDAVTRRQAREAQAFEDYATGQRKAATGVRGHLVPAVPKPFDRKAAGGEGKKDAPAAADSTRSR